MHHRLAGGHRSEVYACTAEGAREAVLKFPAGSAEAEVAALRAWHGSGAAVRLLDADIELGALLLERLRPATPLNGVEDEAAIDVAAGLMRRLHSADPSEFRFFPALEHAYRRYERDTLACAEQSAAGVALLPAARAAAARLSATAGRSVLLHGDFLDKNLLANGISYVAIDPVPSVGDPCADAGFFAACRQPVTAIWERAAALAEWLGEDPARTVRWAAVWAVHEACETWRADSDQVQALMTSTKLTDLLA